MKVIEAKEAFAACGATSFRVMVERSLVVSQELRISFAFVPSLKVLPRSRPRKSPFLSPLFPGASLSIFPSCQSESTALVRGKNAEPSSKLLVFAPSERERQPQARRVYLLLPIP